MRKSGFYMPVELLAGRDKIADLGDPACYFIDFLVASGQSVWQLPVKDCTGFGNPFWLSIASLIADGYLSSADIDEIKTDIKLTKLPESSQLQKILLLAKAAANFKEIFLEISQTSDADADYDHGNGNGDTDTDTHTDTATDNLGKSCIHHFLNFQRNIWQDEHQLLSKKIIADELKNESAVDIVEDFFRKNISHKTDMMQFHQILQYFFHVQWRKMLAYADSHAVQIITSVANADNCRIKLDKTMNLTELRKIWQGGAETVIVDLPSLIAESRQFSGKIIDFGNYQQLSSDIYYEMEQAKRLSPVTEFLAKYSLQARNFDLEIESGKLLAAMEAGLRKDGEIVAMLPTYISTAFAGKEEIGRIIVLDIGGSNLRAGLLEVRANPQSKSFCSTKLLNHKSRTLPGKNEEISYDDFLAVLTELVEEYLPSSQKISLCFSFAAAIKPDRSAEIIAWSKEVNIQEASGRNIAWDLKNKIYLKNKVKTEIMVMNDSVGALLSSLPAVYEHGLRELVGIVHGTGFNVAVPVKYCPKINYASNVPTLINSEMGSYIIENRGLVDKFLDEKSKLPGDHIWEKLLSGEYLGKLVANTLLIAAGAHPDFTDQGGILPEFSEETRQKINNITNRDVSEFLRNLVEAEANFMNAYGQRSEDILAEDVLAECLSDAESRKIAGQIIWSIYDRTAKLLSIVLAASSRLAGNIHSGKTVENTSDTASESGKLAVLIEGNTYHKSFYLPKLMAKHLQINNWQDKFIFLTIPENANLHGSALAWFLL